MVRVVRCRSLSELGLARRRSICLLPTFFGWSGTSVAQRVTSSTVSLSVTIAYEVLLVWLHDVVTGVLSTVRVHLNREFWLFVSALSPPCMTFLMDFLGIVSKQIVARLVELEVVLLRAFHVTKRRLRRGET